MGIRPLPLTSQPDADLARLFQEGDADALDVLLTRYRRFARSRSRSYFLMGGDAEDLEQEALIGLYKAVRDYRPEHEVAFRPFAELCITRQLLSAIKTANRQKHQPLNTSVSIHGTARDADDLEQEALIGLYKAVRDYRPEHEVAFRPFAELCITRQLLSAIKTANRQKHQPLNTSVSLHGAREGGEEEGRTLEERLPSPSATDDPIERLVGDEQVAVLARSMAEDLSELEMQVLRLYVAGRSYVEIADAVGRHAKSVDNAVQRIKRKLGRSLAEYEALSQAVVA